jgi:hypothetical protein
MQPTWDACALVFLEPGCEYRVSPVPLRSILLDCFFERRAKRLELLEIWRYQTCNGSPCLGITGEMDTGHLSVPPDAPGQSVKHILSALYNLGEGRRYQVIFQRMSTWI